MPADAPMAARLLLGVRLRELREHSGVLQSEAALALSGTGSKISRIEGGQVTARPRDVALLADYYQAGTALREELLALAEKSNQRGWWDAPWDLLPAGVRADLSREAAADLLICYDPLAVPAVLQTADYARAIRMDLGWERPWRAGLDARTLARRREIISAIDGPRVWALLTSSVLHRANDKRILQRQVAYLKELSAARVSVQLVPDDAPVHAMAPGPFTLLRYGHRQLPDEVLLESIEGTTLIKRTDYYLELVTTLAAQAFSVDRSHEMLCAAQRELPARPGGGAEAQASE